MFECDIAHRRSVAVLCMPCKIKCNLMRPHNDALPGPYVPVRVTRCALVAHSILICMAHIRGALRILPMLALRRVVRSDYLRDMSYPLPPVHCMQGLLAFNAASELGLLGTGFSRFS